MIERNSARNRPARPSLTVGTLHLAGLWVIALVQPLLSLLGRNPEFFVARDNTGGQIIAFAVLLTFLPPLAAGLLEGVAGLVSRSSRWVLHLALVWLLTTLIALGALKHLWDGPLVPMTGFSALAGAAVTLAYSRPGFIRSAADFLTVAPAVVLAAFLFFSETSDLTLTSPEVEAKAATAANPVPVVMVVFDELPAGSLMTPSGEVNARRFPGFATLARTGTWYRNTISNASYTAISIPSILSGTVPDRQSLPTAEDHPDSLFTLLGDSYRVRAVEPITRLCPDDICETADPDRRKPMLAALDALARDLTWVSAHLLLPASAGPKLPDISQSFEGFGGSRTESLERQRARQWVRDRLDHSETSMDGEADLAGLLRQFEPERRPTFDFVHIEDPHNPWDHYPSGLRYATGDEDFRNFFDEASWHAGRYLTQRAGQAHLLEAGFADTLLDRLVKRLKAEGLWEKSLVVVTSDHGGSIVDGLPRRNAVPENAGTIGLVPLFVKRPGQSAGRTVSRPTCSTEIVPMIAEVLGVPLDWPTGECDRFRTAIDNGTGPLVKVPFSRAVAQRDRYVARLARLFGGDRGWPGVFRLGPRRDLIGRRTGSLQRAPADPGQAATPDPGTAAGSVFRPTESWNPVLRQRGTLSGVAAGQPLAVATRGRIVATGEAYEELGQIRYSILLPPWTLRPGFNRISLFTAVGGTLRRLPTGSQ